jgi:hypothetical protein
MTVGRRLYAFKGELASLQRIVYADAPRPSRFDPQYPEPLEHIVMRALARDPRQRYQSAEQLQIDLEQFALDHRLAVSAVSMAIEMRTLFRDHVEAWSAAERAGQSLGDHLAAAGPQAPIDDLDDLSDDAVADDDAPIDALATAAADQARRAAAARAFDDETRPDVRVPAADNTKPMPPAARDDEPRAAMPRGSAKLPLQAERDDDTRATMPRGTAKLPLQAAPTAPAGPIAPLHPQQLARQLRRPQDVVKIRPSRSVPALVVLVMVLAIAAAWLLLVQRPG